MQPEYINFTIRHRRQQVWSPYWIPLTGVRNPKHLRLCIRANMAPQRLGYGNRASRRAGLRFNQNGRLLLDPVQLP